MDITNVLSELDIHAILQNDIGDDVVLKSYQSEHFEEYVVSSMLKIRVFYVLNGELEDKMYITKFFNKLQEGAASKRLIFDTECKFYCLILPKLDKLLQDSGVPRLCVPKFLHQFSNATFEGLVLQDMSSAGYRLYPKQRSMDWAHFELMAQQMATLHAASMVLLKSRDPALLEALISMRDNYVTCIRNKGTSDFFEGALQNTLKILEQAGGYDNVASFLKKTLVGKCASTCVELTAMEYPPFYTISHGDCWNNNFMFKYDASGAPEAVVWLDWQAVKLSSPAVDMLQALHTSLGAATRALLLPRLLPHYCHKFSAVTRALESNGVPKASAGTEVVSDLAKKLADVEPKAFTLEELTQEMADKYLYGYMMGVLFTPAMLLRRDQLPSGDPYGDLSKAEVRETVMAADNFPDRVLGAFRELQETELFKAGGEKRKRRCLEEVMQPCVPKRGSPI